MTIAALVYRAERYRFVDAWFDGPVYTVRIYRIRRPTQKRGALCYELWIHDECAATFNAFKDAVCAARIARNIVSAERAANRLIEVELTADLLSDGRLHHMMVEIDRGNVGSFYLDGERVR